MKLLLFYIESNRPRHFTERGVALAISPGFNTFVNQVSVSQHRENAKAKRLYKWIETLASDHQSTNSHHRQGGHLNLATKRFLGGADLRFFLFFFFKEIF